MSPWKWWASQRWKYNRGLVISGGIAFLLYTILGEIIIAQHEEFEETIFEILFQAGVYFFMMIVANILYNFGWLLDVLFNKSDSLNFRRCLFTIGYWFSFALPILLILYIMIDHLIHFSNNVSSL